MEELKRLHTEKMFNGFVKPFLISINIYDEMKKLMTSVNGDTVIYTAYLSNNIIATICYKKNKVNYGIVEDNTNKTKIRYKYDDKINRMVYCLL